MRVAEKETHNLIPYFKETNKLMQWQNLEEECYDTLKEPTVQITHTKIFAIKECFGCMQIYRKTIAFQGLRKLDKGLRILWLFNLIIIKINYH